MTVPRAMCAAVLPSDRLPRSGASTVALSGELGFSLSGERSAQNSMGCLRPYGFSAWFLERRNCTNFLDDDPTPPVRHFGLRRLLPFRQRRIVEQELRENVRHVDELRR